MSNSLIVHSPAPVHTVPNGEPSIADRVRAAYPFSVDKYRLSGPDNMRTNWYGLFRSDTGAPVGQGSVSGRYVPHTLDQVADVIGAARDAFDGEVNMTCAFRDGHQIILQPTKAG